MAKDLVPLPGHDEAVAAKAQKKIDDAKNAPILAEKAAQAAQKKAARDRIESNLATLV